MYAQKDYLVADLFVFFHLPVLWYKIHKFTGVMMKKILRSMT